MTIRWDAAMDATLIAARDRFLGWDAVSEIVGVSVETCVRRAVALKLPTKQIGQAGSPWTPCKVETLLAMWPAHSASKVGAKIGLSKNAVIGKIARLGLSDPANRIGQKGKPVPRAVQIKINAGRARLSA